jgi:Barstar (barnase inhibitor)
VTMPSERPWVRGELPWIKSGPLYRIRADALPELSRFLDRWSYRRIELDGSVMTWRREAHDVLKAAFGSPDYYGRNWDTSDSAGATKGFLDLCRAKMSAHRRPSTTSASPSIPPNRTPGTRNASRSPVVLGTQALFRYAGSTALSSGGLPPQSGWRGAGDGLAAWHRRQVVRCDVR